MRSGKVRFGDCDKTERLTQRLVDDKFQTMKSCMGTIMFRDGRLSVTLFVPYLLETPSMRCRLRTISGNTYQSLLKKSSLFFRQTAPKICG